MRFFAATVAALCIGATMARAQDDMTDTPAPATTAKMDAKKEKSIRELLRVTETEKLYKQNIAQMLAAYRKQIPDAPAEFWKKMEAKFADVSPVMDAIVRIYDKHYTQEDIDGLLAFYKTPLGKKYLQELPAIQRESTAFGQEWGAKKGAEVGAEMQAEQSPATP